MNKTRNTATTANFPTTNGNKKKVSELKRQQNQIAVIKSIRVSSWHQPNLQSKLKASWQKPRGVADELTLCF